jgi:hypothetical protein
MGIDSNGDNMYWTIACVNASYLKRPNLNFKLSVADADADANVDVKLTDFCPI